MDPTPAFPLKRKGRRGSWGVIAAINRVIALKIKKYATMSVTAISYCDSMPQRKFCKIKVL